MATPVYVIGIAGSGNGAGKTTFAGMLYQELVRYGWPFRFSFATPLKKMLGTLIGDSPDYRPSHAKKEVMVEPYGISYRDLCISLGRWGREQDEDFWCKALDMAVETTLETCGVFNDRIFVIIDDLRYQNEYAFLRAFHANKGYKGFLAGVYVERPGYTAGSPSENLEHCRGFDIVNNDASLLNLRAQAQSFVQDMVTCFSVLY